MSDDITKATRPKLQNQFKISFIGKNNELLANNDTLAMHLIECGAFKEMRSDAIGPSTVSLIFMDDEDNNLNNALRDLWDVYNFRVKIELLSHVGEVVLTQNLSGCRMTTIQHGPYTYESGKPVYSVAELVFQGITTS